MRGVVGDVAEEAERVFSDVSEGVHGSVQRSGVWIDRAAMCAILGACLGCVCMYVPSM